MMTRKVLYNKSRVRGRPVILHSKQSYSWMVRHIATDKILLVEASFNFGDVWTSFTAKKKLRKITNSRIEGGRHNSPRCSKFRFRRRQDIRHLKEKVRVEFNLRNGTVYRYWRDSASSGVWPKDGRNCARTHAKSGTPRESIVGKETYWSLVKSLDRSDRRGDLRDDSADTLFCGRPSRKVLTWAETSILWCRLSSVSSRRRLSQRCHEGRFGEAFVMRDMP